MCMCVYVKEGKGEGRRGEGGKERGEEESGGFVDIRLLLVLSCKYRVLQGNI